MRVHSLIALTALCYAAAQSQTTSFPLEAVVIEGSSLPQSLILELAGLRTASPIDKAGIERACKNLEETGLFASISYRYAPGPKKGYVVSLDLADQAPLAPAVIDVPGLDEREAWQWLVSRFPRFNHQVPQADPAQQFLARQLEQHLTPSLRGQHLTPRLETDLLTRQMTISFQPEVLPRLQAFTFTGNQTIASADLTPVLNRIVGSDGYTDRKFAAAMELNLRPMYEEHGLYRVRFSPAPAQWTDAGVSVNIAIAEGAPYQLGKVQITGDTLPLDAMLAAAKFHSGKLANWKEIQTGIWDMERVVKRTGYFEATAAPERTYDDVAHILNLRIPIAKGPLYHFGTLSITGLTVRQEEQARRLWRPKPGDNYDYGYSAEFLRDFSASVVALYTFRKYDAIIQAGPGAHVMNISLVFEPR